MGAQAVKVVASSCIYNRGDVYLANHYQAVSTKEGVHAKIAVDVYQLFSRSKPEVIVPEAIGGIPGADVAFASHAAQVTGLPFPIFRLHGCLTRNYWSLL